MKTRSSIALLLLVALAALTMTCTSWQRGTTDVNVTGQDIVYLKDERTNLCFAVLFLRNKVGTSVNDMAMTSVACADLDGVPTR
ncbi:MAG: hypothetical protein ACE5HU_07025 [Acidobacteriota bacterium]